MFSHHLLSSSFPLLVALTLTPWFSRVQATVDWGSVTCNCDLEDVNRVVTVSLAVMHGLSVCWCRSGHYLAQHTWKCQCAEWTPPLITLYH